MDLYNLLISSIINILILIVIESIIYFNVLTVIFEKYINKEIENGGIQINKILNDNIVNIKKIFSIVDDDNKFVSLALKLYTIGIFNKEITNEHDYILNNKIKSYIVFTALLLFILISLIIIKIINYYFFDNDYNANWIFIIINAVISFFILGIFLIPIIVVVFVNIQDNININNLTYQFINNLTYQFIKIFFDLFNKN